jgi:hypothetical protein
LFYAQSFFTTSSQRANAERVKEFSRNLRMINKQMATQASREGRRANKQRPLSKREKAHIYASQIKKPENMMQDFFGVQAQRTNGSGGGAGDVESDDGYGGRQPTYEDISPLDAMELEHEKNRYDVEAIRRGYGI